MKESWEIRTLGEVCEIYQPKTISTKEFKENGQYDVFGANGIIGKYDKYNHEKRELLLTCRGATCGNINVSTPFSWINGNAMVMHIKNRNTLLFDFLKYRLATLDYRNIITGAAQPQITRQTLIAIQISLPPLSEQQRIVEVLDREFERIDTIRKNAETSLQYAKDLMQAKLKEELQYKEGWERKRLGEIIQLLSGQDFPPQKYNDNGEGIPYITGASNFCANGIKINRWTKEPTVLAKQNDILLVVKGSGYGKTMFADFEQAHIARQIMSLRINSDLIKNEYLYYFINSENDYLRDCGVGVIPGISRHNVLDLKISFPPLHEQRQIVSRLDRYSEICKKIEENSKAIITHCDALKQAFLRKAFDGELLS